MRLRALVLPFLSPAAVLMPPGAAAQTGSIAGRVTDSARAEPVSGARIEVRDRSGRVVALASSLPSGRYQVERLGPGLYTVAFRSIGYPPKKVLGVSVANGMTALIDAEAIEAVKPFRLGSLYSPLSLPGTFGGANWEHGAFDPETGMLYVGSYTNLAVLAMAKSPSSDMNFVMVGGRTPSVRGLPVIKPPYSRITAIDLTRGERAWMVASSETPEQIRTNAALQGLTIPETGGLTRAVVLATKTLVFTSRVSAANRSYAPSTNAPAKSSGKPKSPAWWAARR